MKHPLNDASSILHENLTIATKNGLILIDNIYRGIAVCGKPDSQEVRDILISIIDTLIKKECSLCVFDSQFPWLTKELDKITSNSAKQSLPNPFYYLLDLCDTEHSIRINPIHPDRIKSLMDAYYAADRLVQSMSVPKEGNVCGYSYFHESSVIFLSAVIYYLIKHKPSLADLPHVFRLIVDSADRMSLLGIMMKDVELEKHLRIFRPAFMNKDYCMLEGMTGELRVRLSKMLSVEACWVFSGDKLPERVMKGNQYMPLRLIIANHPNQTDLDPWAYVPWFNFIVSYMTEYFTHEHQHNHTGKAVIVEGVDQLFIPKLLKAIGLARSSDTSLILNPIYQSNLRQRYGFDELGTILQTSARNPRITQRGTSYSSETISPEQDRSSHERRLQANYNRIKKEIQELVYTENKRVLAHHSELRTR